MWKNRDAVNSHSKSGSMPTVFNAANEKAVAMFLDRQIGFTGIYDIIEKCMDSIAPAADPSVEEILETEKRVYELIRGWQ